jgi:type VI secretion system secreted protein VgrG
VSEPLRAHVPARQTLQDDPRWLNAQTRKNELLASGMVGDGSVELKSWPAARASTSKQHPDSQDYWISTVLERSVRGELALIALRVMRELGVRHGVPFEVINETEQRFQLPDELRPIAARILEQALAGSEVSLEPEQEKLLLARYIHRSANWTPTSGIFVNKPAPNNQRNVYPNKPQRGYPR